MKMDKTIAVLEGDGIGPEIMREGLKVLDAIAKKHVHKFNYVPAPFGAKAYFEHGHPFPEDTKKICDDADTIIKGPIGLSVQDMKQIPPELIPETAALLPLRKRYETFANYRPVVLPASCSDFSPLRPELIGDGLDILMIRELVGGIYFGSKIEGKEGRRNKEGQLTSMDECLYDEDQVTRIAHVAFKEAQKRKSKLTNVDKRNVLATSRFWSSVVEDLGRREYPDVPLESMLVDNVAYQLVINPRQFNGVMLLENMQGDIITDEAGGILGSLGLMPSACIGPKKGYFEPSHGSAPNIANQNKANPYSMIGSVALMLEKALGSEEGAKDVWSGLTRVFGDGYRTGELARSHTPKEKILSTSEFGDLVTKHILSSN
jgi:3-isopropylmalate dehydrogenase